MCPTMLMSQKLGRTYRIDTPNPIRVDRDDWGAVLNPTTSNQNCFGDFGTVVPSTVHPFSSARGSPTYGWEW